MAAITNDSSIYQKVGHIAKQIRKERHISQLGMTTEISKRKGCKVDQSQISRIESGSISNYETLEEYASALGLQVWQLFYIAEEKEIEIVNEYSKKGMLLQWIKSTHFQN